MRILYLSHCPPYPPDKGDRIRAYHILRLLAQRHEVHMVCLARNAQELAGACPLGNCPATVEIVPVSRLRSYLRVGVAGLLGQSVTVAYYREAGFKRHVDEALQAVRPDVVLAYSTPMGCLAPNGIPLVLDMTDVDSAKWLAYSQFRWPGWLYRLEAERLRLAEAKVTAKARVVAVSTLAEKRLLRLIAPQAHIVALPNGVDLGYYNPAAIEVPDELRNREFCAFVGQMDYFPNLQAALWFATQVLPYLRRRRPRLEFFIIGRNPPRSLRALASRPGVVVMGAVADVRPFLVAARFVVVPLIIARGIQNKVLEALAMGKRVLVSPAVAETFGHDLPLGATVCADPSDYERAADCPPSPSPEQIRQEVARRFSWDATVEQLETLLASASGAG